MPKILFYALAAMAVGFGGASGAIIAMQQDKPQKPVKNEASPVTLPKVEKLKAQTLPKAPAAPVLNPNNSEKQEVGRYSIVNTGEATILLDTKTGASWLLLKTDEGMLKFFVPIEKIDDHNLASDVLRLFVQIKRNELHHKDALTPEIIREVTDHLESLRQKNSSEQLEQNKK